ncbi:hypothetical protein [Natranaeroarchaeum sulfidigenes]|uniref:C2H2-type domain-containing protein n=1 Tax=Natranaeroarchaeum sulfidigenes TaxID=2784880 RepID=A0A897MW32_9EURY|nr:hypothetical protein [Natranaeroarchaeum sulfidigenes]QSG02505.1 hypothetical protein AArcS_1288 [Natranaeroarchaeum sulfidigenes]
MPTRDIYANHERVEPYYCDGCSREFETLEELCEHACDPIMEIRADGGQLSAEVAYV